MKGVDLPTDTHMSQATLEALAKLQDHEDQHKTVLPEQRESPEPRGTCHKDRVKDHLGQGCRNCFERSGPNEGDEKAKKKKKCLRRSQGWPGEFKRRSNAPRPPAALAAASVITSVTTPAATAAANSVARRPSPMGGKRNASSAAATANPTTPKKMCLRPNPAQRKLLGRNTESAEKSERRQRKRPRADEVCYGNSSIRVKGARQQRARRQKAAAAEAAAAAAAEEELLGGDLSSREIRYLGRCLGVRDDDKHLDVICKLVRASARCVTRAARPGGRPASAHDPFTFNGTARPASDVLLTAQLCAPPPSLPMPAPVCPGSGSFVCLVRHCAGREQVGAGAA